MQNHPKLLLAVDGSDHALNAIRHISQMFSRQFHVLPDIPEAFKDARAERSINAQEFPLETWKAHQAANMLDFIEKARDALIGSVLPEIFTTNRIAVIRPLWLGVAESAKLMT
jgi:hypothetical protein